MGNSMKIPISTAHENPYIHDTIFGRRIFADQLHYDGIRVVELSSGKNTSELLPN